MSVPVGEAVAGARRWAGGVSPERTPTLIFPAGAPSRGELVPRYVAGDLGPLDFLAELEADARRYAGFNLLVGDASGIAWFSNADGRSPHVPAVGIHALSNGIPGAEWPKVRLARARLDAALANSEPDDEGLLEVLAPRSPAPDAELPDTGVGLELERALSPPFIVRGDYGTRSTTVLVLGSGGRGRVLERSYDPLGRATTTLCFALATTR